MNNKRLGDLGKRDFVVLDDLRGDCEVGDCFWEERKMILEFVRLLIYPLQNDVVLGCEKGKKFNWTH